MNEYLKLKKSNCKNCYKCIRHCPVKSIRFSDNQANIVGDECILCGQCFIVCPQNAKEIRNDVETVKSLIKSGKPVYVSLAPAFAANYEGVNINTMESALKKLGFFGVEETAVGAAIVKNCYDDMINSGEHDLIISSCCHTINLLIQKYYPEALQYLAHIKSPMQAHCAKIKSEHPEALTVFIGPCISKKAEAAQYPENVDCVLTFEELSNWMAAERIILDTADKEKTIEDIGKTRLFPTSGGILRSMSCDDAEFGYIAIDGLEKCIETLKDVSSGNITKCFIEMSACSGSCIGGPTMDKDHRSPIKDFILINKFAGSSDFDVDKYTYEQLKKDMPFIGVHKQMPGSKAIEDVLRSMGKKSAEYELNCGSCGYDTCREKAIAVLLGKADLSMCLPYLKEKAESFSDNIINNTPNGIIVIDESLKVQEINSAACRIINIKNPNDILGDNVVRILDPQIFLEVMQEEKNVDAQLMYLPEYQKCVDVSVIYDKDYHIMMVIMRDVTDVENEKRKKERVNEKAIEITDKVIDKQMRIVQEIASLLGETTAETKVALTSLKESLKF